ncbi:MAG TPA: GNAT family N-acetyltransferase [Ktedonobacteraceae bacterium]|nr:GNAT family N-acetyltransferase [Ktedonobacteraceae bacterium]
MAENPQSERVSIAVPSLRFATAEDIAQIDELDRLSNSPTRDIHRDMEKYFGSVDPSTHEQTLILLAVIGEKAVGKAELMIAPQREGTVGQVGYIKRVIVDPHFRAHGLARRMLQHLIDYARNDLHLQSLDLHVWEENHPALRLYQALGFEVQHRELYLKLTL